jgi:phosphoribosylformylglycinamidine synthase
VAVAVAEACFQAPSALATPRLVGATLDLSTVTGLRTDALLFGESQHRVVVTTSGIEAGKVMAQAKALGLAVQRLGTVGGSDLVIRLSSGEFRVPVAELHDGWWNAIARLMD